MWYSICPSVKFVLKLRQSELTLLTELPSILLKTPSKKIMSVFLHWFLMHVFREPGGGRKDNLWYCRSSFGSYNSFHCSWKTDHKILEGFFENLSCRCPFVPSAVDVSGSVADFSSAVVDPALGLPVPLLPWLSRCCSEMLPLPDPTGMETLL